MILKAHFRLLLLLAALAITGLTQATPPTMTHQGRLLDDTDKPVADGSYGATFSLWDAPVAGSMVWSEVQDIQTRSGLFSVELGQVNSFFDVFTEFADQDLYLQTQVQISGGMQELSPRLRIGTAPFASVAKRVHAIHNGPAMRAVSTVAATDSGAVSALSVDLDGDGVPDRSIDQDCDGISASLHVMKSPPNIGSSGQDGVSLVVDDNSSSSVVAHDLDSDGDPDVVVSSVCDASSAKHAINTKGTGTDKGRLASVTSTTTPTSASGRFSLDLDGDDVLDRRIDDDCDDVSASRSMSFFDVFTEMKIDDDCDGVSARRRLSSSNIGSSGQDGVAVQLACSPDSANQSTEIRRNGAVVCADYGRHTPFHNSRSMSFFDIFTEMSIDQDCDVTGSRMAINTKGTGAQRTVACSTDESSSSVVASGDLDGDGLDDSEAALRISPTKSSLAVQTKGTSAKRLRGGTDCDDNDARNYLDSDDDGDGIAERSVSCSVTPTTSSMAINTKGTGAQRTTIDLIGTPDSAMTVLESDEDGDGNAEFGVRLNAQPLGSVSVPLASSRVSSDPNDDGIDDNTAEMIVTPTTSSVAIKTKGTGADKDRVVIITGLTALGTSLQRSAVDEDGDGDPETEISQSLTPTTSSVAIKTKGTGADPNRSSISNSCSPSSSSLVCDQDSDGDGVAESSITQVCGSGGGGGAGGASLTLSVKDASYRGHVTVLKAAAVMTDMDSDGNAYFDGQLGIGVTASHRIDVVGGAHCDGTNWVNASDENSKENFQPVDGEEILEKLEDLEITQWNYKNESDEVTHIGPTAQDFQKTFGVGSDGKSISTIDPSGIALVAVKELRKENQELKAQVDELKKMVEELAKKK